MKYFKLFEQFIVESAAEELEKKKAELDKVESDYAKAKAEYEEPLKDMSLDQEANYVGGKPGAKFQKTREKWYDTKKQLEADIAALTKKVKDEAKASGKSSDKKLSKKDEAVFSKLQDLEDTIQMDIGYEFSLVPSKQFLDIADGDNKAARNVKQKITELQDTIAGQKSALEDAKLDKDREAMKYHQAKIKATEAEIAVYDACLGQDVKQLAGGLSVLAKAAKVIMSIDEE